MEPDSALVEVNKLLMSLTPSSAIEDNLEAIKQLDQDALSQTGPEAGKILRALSELERISPIETLEQCGRLLDKWTLLDEAIKATVKRNELRETTLFATRIVQLRQHYLGQLVRACSPSVASFELKFAPTSEQKQLLDLDMCAGDFACTWLDHTSMHNGLLGFRDNIVRMTLNNLYALRNGGSRVGRNRMTTVQEVKRLFSELIVEPCNNFLATGEGKQVGSLMALLRESPRLARTKFTASSAMALRLGAICADALKVRNDDSYMRSIKLA